MRKLIVAIVLLALVGCASVPKQAAPGVKQVAPLSEIAVFSCGKFLGAIVTLPDGAVETIDDEAIAKAVYNALPDGHAAIVRTAEDCPSTQST